jgi:hypothetical protein
MQSRDTIEKQLRHYRRDCAGPADERAHAVKTLEWVLGDEAHQKAYGNGIAALVDIRDDPESSREILRFALETALRLLE